MRDAEDVKPFPIQGEHHDRVRYPACTIPWWLAEVAYAEYARQFGTDQSIERMAERAGFGRTELMSLLRGEHIMDGNPDSWRR